MEGETRRRGRRKAVALGYQADKDQAPRILATGSGAVAEAILELARARGVPIWEDAALSGVLGTLELGQEIPPELYQAVAEILAFLWRMEVQVKEEQGS